MIDTPEIQIKREEEKETFAQMIEIYCHGKHKTKKGELCEECLLLKNYSEQRTDHCPHMATKTFCTACPKPCYSTENRLKIKEIMKYSGPRMLFYSPSKAIHHMKIVMDNRRKENAH